MRPVGSWADPASLNLGDTAVQGVKTHTKARVQEAAQALHYALCFGSPDFALVRLPAPLWVSIVVWAFLSS